MGWTSPPRSRSRRCCGGSPAPRASRSCSWRTTSTRCSATSIACCTWRPGAPGAALIGIPTSLGYYIACAAAAVTIGGSGRARGASRSAETAAVGTIQATGLAAGFLFLSLNHQVLGGPESLLFGTFLGISRTQVLVLLAIGAAALLALALCARPLLLSTLDREVARASGVPVVALENAFLLILAAAVATASQITGAL